MSAIRGTASFNPTFHMTVQHVGIMDTISSMNVSFAHGGQNWGSTVFVKDDAAPQLVLNLITTNRLIGSRRVSLLKIDCEGDVILFLCVLLPVHHVMV